MDLTRFNAPQMGNLVEITGQEPDGRPWRHKAFLPAPLPDSMPALTTDVILRLGEARAALAALDSTASQLPDPRLFRDPLLRLEAQSTSALEGTYAPVPDVVAADEEHVSTKEMREVLNYVRMASTGFRWQTEGRQLTSSLLTALQGQLMEGTPLAHESGRLRTMQVVVGRRDDRRADAPLAHQARFIPAPPGDQLHAGVEEFLGWKSANHSGSLDPLIATAMSHYQFETLHPFRDGNGRLGRYLIVWDLHALGVLQEPTLTVSPWFEQRRTEYYDRLFDVSAIGDWNSYFQFFLTGLASSAQDTRTRMLRLIAAREKLSDQLRESNIRGESAFRLLEHATARPVFTVPQASAALDLSPAGARRVVEQLVRKEILAPLDPDGTYRRRYFVPLLWNALIGE
ncbi:Fic family protein [Micrococcus sp. FDAARGOS_333]|uniref:Fic family protein n=1 Tax=Micrococcus sp. FDAARGOS_333 TaxID=1930558 RepID=UPI001D0FF6BB|nr:Fic/DOC family N-terminal domain-containing protein [Micrococcus sp. FDAARGOS_333]